jgi:hypothetical protein
MIPKVTFRVDDPHEPFVKIMVGEKTLGYIERFRRWDRGQMQVWMVDSSSLCAHIDR